MKNIKTEVLGRFRLFSIQKSQSKLIRRKNNLRFKNRNFSSFDEENRTNGSNDKNNSEIPKDLMNFCLLQELKFDLNK